MLIMIFPEFSAFVGFCLLSTTVKVFIGYILWDLDLQDSEVLTRQKETIRSRRQQLLSKA